MREYRRGRAEEDQFCETRAKLRNVDVCANMVSEGKGTRHDGRSRSRYPLGSKQGERVSKHGICILDS